MAEITMTKGPHTVIVTASEGWMDINLDGKLYYADTIEPCQVPGRPDIVAKIWQVGLTADERDAVQSMMDADPIYRRRKAARAVNQLIRDRDDIQLSINAWIATDHDAHVQYIERISAYGRAKQPIRHEAEIAALRTELAEFDAAHPEIVAEIERRKQSDIERHTWD